MSKIESKLVTKMRNMISDSDNLDDLKIIKDAINYRMETVAKRNSHSFKEGDEVRIVGSGRINAGIIQKVNITRALVLSGKTSYDVPFVMLRKKEA
tara:strand:- start:562 stop:849 length:288 start_codon:yes stop_codon:yes gene_type:complete